MDISSYAIETVVGVILPHTSDLDWYTTAGDPGASPITTPDIQGEVNPAVLAEW